MNSGFEIKEKQEPRREPLTADARQILDKAHEDEQKKASASQFKSFGKLREP